VFLRVHGVRDVVDDLATLFSWDPVVIDAAVLELRWKIQDRSQFSYWDALIVAAAKTSSCRCLLSEDFHHGQNLDGIEMINPFLKDPWS
jgi:predicted nucleic acid-binding protein